MSSRRQRLSLCVLPDYVSVPVEIMVNKKIKVTSGKFDFYNCAATVRKNQNTPYDTHTHTHTPDTHR